MTRNFSWEICLEVVTLHPRPKAVGRIWEVSQRWTWLSSDLAGFGTILSYFQADYGHRVERWIGFWRVSGCNDISLSLGLPGCPLLLERPFRCYGSLPGNFGKTDGKEPEKANSGKNGTEVAYYT